MALVLGVRLQYMVSASFLCFLCMDKYTHWLYMEKKSLGTLENHKILKHCLIAHQR